MRRLGIDDGFERIVRELFFPDARGQFFHLGGWMPVHSLQDVDQTGVGMNALHPAGHQQAPDDADMFSTQLCWLVHFLLRCFERAQNMLRIRFDHS